MKKEIKELIFGVAGTGGGIAVSLSTAEAWLRVASLAVGILVGVLSAISISLSIRRKWKKQKEETDI